MVIMGFVSILGPTILRLLVRREKNRFEKADSALEKKASIEMDRSIGMNGTAR